MILTEYIAESLEIPPITSLDKTASEYIDNLLSRPIFHESSEIGDIQVSAYPKRESTTETKKLRRIHRQNKLLLDSLEVHITQHGRWRVFVQWKKSWAICQSCVQNIRLATHEIIEKFLKLEDKNLLSTMKSLTATGKIAHGITVTIWEHIKEHGLTGHLPSVTLNEFLQLEGSGSEFSIRRLLSNTINKLYKTESIQYIRSLDTALRNMKKSITQIEEDFDGIKLRPLLLNSRCQLCP